MPPAHLGVLWAGSLANSHGERRAHRAIAVVWVARRAGDGGAADRKGRAGLRRAGDRCARRIVFVLCGGGLVGHYCPCRAGGAGRYVRWQPDQGQVMVHAERQIVRVTGGDLGRLRQTAHFRGQQAPAVHGTGGRAID